MRRGDIVSTQKFIHFLMDNPGKTIDIRRVDSTSSITAGFRLKGGKESIYWKSGHNASATYPIDTVINAFQTTHWEVISVGSWI